GHFANECPDALAQVSKLCIECGPSDHDDDCLKLKIANMVEIEREEDEKYLLAASRTAKKKGLDMLVEKQQMQDAIQAVKDINNESDNIGS
ncbi:hypothetical protein KI387_014545, partial [Taxus chinensis]